MPETGDEKQKAEVQFSQEQYDLLMKCSGKRDMTEWNEWREGHEEEEELLKGAELRNANLQGASLGFANLEGAWLDHANLEGADLKFSILQGAVLAYANLEGAKLEFSNLQGALLAYANLEGVELTDVCMIKANFKYAKVNGETLIDENCEVNHETDFTGVGLASARIDPGLRARLEGNIRKKRWKTWCRTHFWGLGWMAMLFWLLSDYGRSTKRLIFGFIAAAVVFAELFFFCCYYDINYCGIRTNPGVVSNLFVGDMQHVPPGPPGPVFLRALYFSVVTMTTLGFGDMHANPASPWGHVVLIIQVLIGYVLLAALVTRLAVLFTGSGPEGKSRESVLGFLEKSSLT
jgi:hypothetical protein